MAVTVACLGGKGTSCSQCAPDTSRCTAQVRFFERVKLERCIRRLQAAAQAARAAGGEPIPADTVALAQAQDDLQVRPGVLLDSAATCYLCRRRRKRAQRRRQSHALRRRRACVDAG